MSSQKGKMLEIYNLLKKKISNVKCKNNQSHPGKKSFCTECKEYFCEKCLSKHSNSHKITQTDKELENLLNNFNNIVSSSSMPHSKIEINKSYEDSILQKMDELINEFKDIKKTI